MSETDDNPAPREPHLGSPPASPKPALWSVPGSGPAKHASTQSGQGVASSVVSSVVSFDRHELRIILNVYGRKVAEGEWRDYAIDFTTDKAVFSIFRRTSEVPLFKIEKDPKMARKQGAYCVVASGGLIMKRGHELARVVEVLDRKTRFVVV